VPSDLERLLDFARRKIRLHCESEAMGVVEEMGLDHS